MNNQSQNIEIDLDKFIRQSLTDNLKTKGLYPSNLLDLDVKVSFGMGTPTHIPWISFLGPNMTTSNGFYPVYLYYKKLNTLILSYGISETKVYEDPWTKEIINSSTMIEDTIKNPFKYGKSFIYKVYKIEIHDDEIIYKSEDNRISHEMLSKDLQSIIDKYKKCLDITVQDKSSELSKGLFYMENHLEEFILKNWDKSEFGKKFDLIYEDGELKSQQYRTDIGPIDILALDKKTNEYVVIELKRNQTGDETIGQVARYMQWVDENLSPKVKGIIVCGKWDKKLDFARKRLGDVEVLLYEVDFRLKEYKK